VATPEGASFLLRPVQDSDVRFISETWRRHYELSPIVQVQKQDGGMTDEMYRKRQDVLIGRLLGGESALVAAAPDDPTFLYGWLCGLSDPITGIVWIHYAFVKSEFRRHGIFRALLAALGADQAEAPQIFYTHMPPNVGILRHHPAWKHLPLELR